MERKGGRTARKPERIGQLLTVAAAAAQSLARERLRPLGLTPRGWAVLSALAEGGPRPQIDLAAATGTDRTVMTYLLDELERQNLIERARDLSDRRSYQIHLTRRGEETHRRVASELAVQADTLLRPLDAPDRRQLADLLTRVADGRALREGAMDRPPRSSQALAALETLAGSDSRPKRRTRRSPHQDLREADRRALIDQPPRGGRA